MEPMDPKDRFIARQLGKKTWEIHDNARGWTIARLFRQQDVDEHLASLVKAIDQRPRYWVHKGRTPQYAVMDAWANPLGQVVGIGPHWEPVATFDDAASAMARCNELNEGRA